MQPTVKDEKIEKIAALIVKLEWRINPVEYMRVANDRVSALNPEIQSEAFKDEMIALLEGVK